LRRNRGATGYTVIELAVVLAILGLALTMAVPLFARHLTGAALDAANSQVRAALRGARSTAIAEDRAVVFQGDSGGGYWLDRQHFTLPAVSGSAPAQIAVGNAGRITFYPSGGSSGGRILVTNRAGDRVIAVDALSGRADAIR